MSAADYPRIHPKTAAEWRRWLRHNHDKAQGVWLVMYKAATGKTRLAYEDSIPDALCFGWIDSVEALEVPDDLRRALGAAGMRKFGALTPGRRKEHLRTLVTAKRPSTRAKRIADIVRVARRIDADGR